MANKLIYGFRPSHTVSGDEIVIHREQVVSNNSAAIFKGDCAVWTGAGWDLATAGTSQAVGSVFMDFEYRKADGKITREPYLPAGTTYTEADGEDGCTYAQIVKNVHDVVFEVSVDAAIAETDLYLNYNMVATAAGSTVTGLSGQQLTATSRATTGTLQFRVLKFVKRVTNDRTLANALVFAMINLNTGLNPALSTTGA